MAHRNDKQMTVYFYHDGILDASIMVYFWYMFLINVFIMVYFSFLCHGKHKCWKTLQQNGSFKAFKITVLEQTTHSYGLTT